MAGFENNLEKYAELAIRNAINIQEGQTLVITSPITAVDFVRNLTEKAYKVGAKHVYVEWNDDLLTLVKYRYAPDEAFKEFPMWKAQGMEEMAANGAAFLSIYAPNPDLLQDIDPEKIAAVSKTASQALKNFSAYKMSDKVSWTILSVPTKEWAEKVFPEHGEEEAVNKLWDAIFAMTRADQENPVDAWSAHQDQLNEKLDYLNGKSFSKLHYHGPGTDLTIELPKDHIWVGGGAKNEKGDSFIPNVPTEEVFTLPLKTGVNGTVSSTKPLNHGGNLIENFSFTFQDGKIIDFKAEKGYETLKQVIETDEGAHFLGEVALVPHDSPISQSGLIFYNTLFDENASCHLAIGRAYPCFEDGMKISQEEAEKRGANNSLVHVDFMIGSAELDIDGETKDGKNDPIFREGNWAF
ncbi:MAG TPA: aminopeptidase [Bacillales bacterium]|nr:aminopeptidase [Bacillales bacterium]